MPEPTAAPHLHPGSCFKALILAQPNSAGINVLSSVFVCTFTYTNMVLSTSVSEAGYIVNWCSLIALAWLVNKPQDPPPGSLSSVPRYGGFLTWALGICW